jgi:hypothetical protein
MLTAIGYHVELKLKSRIQLQPGTKLNLRGFVEPNQ